MALPIASLDGVIIDLVAAGEWAYLLTEPGSVFGLHGGGTPIALLWGEGVTDLAASQTDVIATTGSANVWTAQVVAAEGWFAALTPDGQVLSWAVNAHGAPADTGLTNIQEIAASGKSLVALDQNGEVFTWERDQSSQPVDLSALGGVTPSAVSAGSEAMSILADGLLYPWGNGASGQWGTGTQDDLIAPMLGPNFWPTGVLFGEEAATNVTAQSRTKFTASTPAQKAQLVDVSVTYQARAGEGGGTEETTFALQKAFTYESAKATLGSTSSATGKGVATWCDKNPNSFYSLTTTTPALGGALVGATSISFNATIREYQIQGSGSNVEVTQGPETLNQTITITRNSTNWLWPSKSSGVNALGVAPNGTA